MADITYDNLRIQIEHPCECWEEPYTIYYYDCDKSASSPDQIQISRSNCDINKIVAWLTSTGNTNVSGNNEQVVARCVNNCDTTESRKDTDSLKFNSSIEVNTDKQEVELRCGGSKIGELGLDSGLTVYPPLLSGECVDVSGNTIKVYYTAASNPIDDIENNNNREDSERRGLYCTQISSYFKPFIQYGTKNNSYYNGDIVADCITGSSYIFFLYIPCGHYSDDGSGQPYGTIKSGAFKRLTNLKGVWINGSWTLDDSNGGPFAECSNLEIAYCPSSWFNYFLTFRNMRYINGRPVRWDDDKGICVELNTSTYRCKRT